MKSIKQLMEEMGFNKNASLDSQKAFVKHLVSAANQTRLSTIPVQKNPPREDESNTTKVTSSSTKVQPIQLTFNFLEDDDGKQVS
jgi:hypothetical protein